MSDTVTIDARYCGPPTSGNGGYTAGALAQAMGIGAGDAVEIRLRVPPPLEVALTVERAGEVTRLVDHTGAEPVVVAEGRRVDAVELDPPTAATLLEATTATTPFDGVPLGARGPTGALWPLDEPAMYARGFLYEDVVKAVDVVVSKPGYGIIAECAANQTALLYTSRGHFREYDVLVAGMPRYLRARFLDQATLLAGRWEPALDALLAAPAPPERADVTGAEVAAARLLDMMGTCSTAVRS